MCLFGERVYDKIGEIAVAEVMFAGQRIGNSIINSGAPLSGLDDATISQQRCDVACQC
jgi:hypothetical protein